MDSFDLRPRSQDNSAELDQYIKFRACHIIRCYGRMISTPYSNSGEPGLKVSSQRPGMLTEVFRSFFYSKQSRDSIPCQKHLQGCIVAGVSTRTDEKFRVLDNSVMAILVPIAY
jgi:hypothetical protein